MKRLYLVRHAKSSWKDPGLTDRERPLNTRGKRDAPRMGQRLAEQGVEPDLILSSPAKRALKTAKAVAKKIGYPKDRIEVRKAIYTGGPTDVLTEVRGVDDSVRQLMVFGHNPGFTELANALTEQQIDNLPSCGVFCVDFDVGPWSDVSPGQGIFVCLDYPKKP